MSKRDDFSPEVKELLAKRVGYLCSHPGCRKNTIGPQMGDDKTVNIGEAAHICAASPGGKRYDKNMTHEERSSFDNGIWLCRNCAALIDRDENIFTTALLKQWKSAAENNMYERISKDDLNLSEATQIKKYQYALLLDNLVDCKKWHNLFSSCKHAILDQNNFPLPQNWDKQIEGFVEYIGIEDSIRLNKICANIDRLKTLMTDESMRIKRKYPRGSGRIADYESVHYCGQLDAINETLNDCFTNDFITKLYSLGF